MFKCSPFQAGRSEDRQPPPSSTSIEGDQGRVGWGGIDVGGGGGRRGEEEEEEEGMPPPRPPPPSSEDQGRIGWGGVDVDGAAARRYVSCPRRMFCLVLRR